MLFHNSLGQFHLIHVRVICVLRSMKLGIIVYLTFLSGHLGALRLVGPGCCSAPRAARCPGGHFGRVSGGPDTAGDRHASNQNTHRSPFGAALGHNNRRRVARAVRPAEQHNDTLSGTPNARCALLLVREVLIRPRSDRWAGINGQQEGYAAACRPTWAT